jgi:hypothetical protein
MTAVAELVVTDQARQPSARAARWRSPVRYPILVALGGAVAFVLADPQVGDLWAARARQSAAGHGVGLTYWFSWFGGGAVPGTYSVLTPYLSSLIGATLLGALATVATTPLCWRLVRDTSHPLAATWAATIAAGFDLWSGRIPFSLGTALSVAALIAVRDRRVLVAAAWTVLAVLASPVSGAFLLLGLVGVTIHVQSHRLVSATTMLTSGLSLLVVLFIFGSPGPEGFTGRQAVVTALALSLFLLARPPKFLTSVIAISIVACPLLVAVPNGMGSNFQRLVWICLPVAVIATSRRRVPVTVLACVLALFAGVMGTIQDLTVASQPMSSTSYYTALTHELDTLHDLTSYRLEAVPDGTHTASFALLDHAMLARGYETQADNALNAVLLSQNTLDAVSYKIWLDNNAVGFVAIGKAVLHPNPEFALVSTANLPYLKRVWNDANWTLYRVTDPTPIVPAPARIVDAYQSYLVIDIPQPGTLPVRVRWSRFLVADPQAGGPAVKVADDGNGWTLITTAQPGRYVLHG